MLQVGERQAESKRQAESTVFSCAARHLLNLRHSPK